MYVRTSIITIDPKNKQPADFAPFSRLKFFHRAFRIKREKKVTNASVYGFIIYHFNVIEYLGKSYFTRSNAAERSREPFDIGFE